MLCSASLEGPMDTIDLRERVARACRVLGRLDLTKAGTGHISARLPGTDRILIRARGPEELGVRYTSKDQVLECDLDGKPLDGGPGLEAPLEIFIHTAIYRARPNVGSVVHMHPPTVVLFTICNKPLLPIYGSYDQPSAALALEGIPLFDRSILIDTPALGAELAKSMGGASVCMMRGHGITTIGETIEQAAINAIHLNELATMSYHANLLGEPSPISAEDQETFRAMASRFAGLEVQCAAALWRYYVALTGA